MGTVKRGRGRPTKFSQEIADRIVQYLTAGGYIETAAAASGLHKDTLYTWLKRGGREPEGKFHEFADAVAKALADAETRATAQILLAGKKEWTALAWYLERRFPDRWGRRRVEVTGADGSPIQTESVVTVYLPDNDRT